jgi:hypothetical protein
VTIQDIILSLYDHAKAAYGRKTIMPMAGQPIIVSTSDDKACPKPRGTH